METTEGQYFLVSASPWKVTKAVNVKTLQVPEHSLPQPFHIFVQTRRCVQVQELRDTDVSLSLIHI